MKKKISKAQLFLTFIIAAISIQSSGQETIQYDSIYSDYSFRENGAASKNLYRYDEDGIQIEYEAYNFDNANRSWIGRQKMESTNSEGATSYIDTYYRWDSEISDWGEHYLKTEYEVNGEVTISETYLWDDNNQTWTYSAGSKRKKYTKKNENDLPIEIIYYNWDENTSDWITTNRWEYEYDNNGNYTLIKSFTWDVGSNSFQPSLKIIYSYDAYNNELTREWYRSDENNQLYKYSEHTYENSYDANDNLISVIITNYHLTWNSTSLSKIDYLYDDNNNKTTSIHYSWNSSSNSWSISNRQSLFEKDSEQTFNSLSPSNFAIIKGTLFEIPVLEKPAATSRVWKYRQVGESVYSHFSPSQTNQTLSKTFTEPGDYEIVCESTIGGNTFTSNTATLKIVGLNISPTTAQNIEVDQLGNTLSVSESPKADSRSWYYSKTSGGPYNMYASGGYMENYNPQFSEPGIFYLVCKSRWGNTSVVSNEVIINVSGTKLSSTETQLLNPNEIGESISVIEYPPASSREWKYKTSGTGIWKSFSPSITTSDYSPSFSAIGEYHVACFSAYGTETKMSDIVKIWVVEQNRIDPVSEQTIDVLTNGTELYVTETPTADSRYWRYSKTKDGYTQNTYTSSTNYTPNFSEPGVYYVVCESEYGDSELVSNQIKINVIGNSISPSENQSIVAGNIGNTLKVNENTNASSREWKYKTSEFGTWQSFSPAQDTTFLNPSFSTLGTYFIACFSTINGKTFTSNEVRVRVVDNNTISPSANQAISINTDGNLLTVSENPEADSRRWHVSRVSGEYSYQTNTYEYSDTYQPNFSESGTYYVVCQSEWDNITVTSNEVMVSVDGYGNATLSNSIAPVSEQVIDVNTYGTELTVTETPTADSRYWYYSENEAEDFNNNTYSTGTTFIPYFYSPGVYHVICKSKLDTLYHESNSVKISVHGNKISTTSSQYLVVGYNGNGLSVKEYPTASSREWKYKLTSEGIWQSFTTPETDAVYTPNFTISGEYYVACFSVINGKTYETDDVRIRVSDNNITPTATQYINPNSDGNTLAVNETYSSIDKEWYASTASGKEYFNYLGEGSTYTPNISEAGVYYVVCKSTWSNGSVFSNEVLVDVSGNNISPVHDQIISPNANGATLTVSEYPAATSREWKYKTSSSGIWTSFSTVKTAGSYAPSFSVSGTYHVACFSVIEGITYTSNEVMVTVANTSIAPTTVQTIPVNTNGSPLSVTETVSADSRGWYYSNNSGSAYDNYLGDGISYTPNFSTVGEYFVVCKSFWGNTSSISNEVKVVIAGNNITPLTEQVIAVNSNGISINAIEHPTATSREWKYKITSGGNWQSFATPETDAVYTPNFTTSGEYYVVCFSQIGDYEYVSEEVKIIVVSNSITPATDQLIEPDSNGAQLIVTETYPADSREWFYSETSGGDYNNSLGDGITLTPNFSTVEDYYIVCKSIWGATSAFSNEVKVTVKGVKINPKEDQTIIESSSGTSLSVSEYPAATSREWKYKTLIDGAWISFDTPETSNIYVPFFDEAGTYYIACFSEIDGKTYESNSVVITVTISTSTSSLSQNGIQIYPNPTNNNFIVQQNGAIAEILIHTMEGELIYFNNNIQKESTLITLSTKGLHIITIKTNTGKILTDKIIIF